MLFWLRMWTEQFDPMEWLTIGLLVFAGVMILVEHRRDLRTRQKDEAAEERDIAIAARTVHAEAFRLFQLADRFERPGFDFVQYAADGMLNPNEARLGDPSLMAQMLARLGKLPANLGVPAITLASDSAAAAADFAKIAIEEMGPRMPVQGAGPMRFRKYSDEQLRQMADGVIFGIRETGLLLEDALQQHPSAHATFPAEFLTEPKSGLGQSLKQEFEARNAAVPLPKGRWRLRSPIWRV